MSFEDFNVHLFQAINSLAGTNPYLDMFMIFSAKFIIFIVPLYLIYMWFRNKNEDRNLSVFIFITVLVALAVSIFIGRLYYHPRPFVMGLGTQLISHAADSSFPSDHTTVMFAFSIPFLLFRRYKEGSVLVFLAALVGYARVFCGVHFPLDIIGGFTVALIVSCVMYMFRNPLMDCISKITAAYENFVKRVKS